MNESKVIKINGLFYKFVKIYNESYSYYSLSIFDNQDNLILASKKLVEGCDLLEFVKTKLNHVLIWTKNDDFILIE